MTRSLIARMPTLGLIVVPLLALLAACAETHDEPEAAPASVADPLFHADNQHWKRQRREELLRPHGWASLVGMHWLEYKAHYIGSSPRSSVRLSVGPPSLGLIERQPGLIWFTPEPGVAVTIDGKPLGGRARIHSDRDGVPTVIGFDAGKGQLTVIERGGRQALRIRHADAPTRLAIGGLDYWPADPAWRVSGRFTAHPEGTTLAIIDIINTSSELPNPGRIEFSHGGADFTLETLEGEGGGLLVVLADRTSGQGSYAAGRFLDVDAPDAQGNVVLDFNRAYNPPCAFTAFATCPLPPAQNRLELAIAAGERTYTMPPG